MNMKRRYFPDQVLSEDSELGLAETRERGAYVAAVYAEGKRDPQRLEVVVGGRITLVVYPGEESVEQVLAAHVTEYPDSAIVIRKPSRAEADGMVQEELQYSQGGVLMHAMRTFLIGDQVQSVAYSDEGGQLMRTDRYEYEADQLVRVTVLDEQGKLLHEERC